MIEALTLELELDDQEALKGLSKVQRRERALDLLDELLDCVGGADISLIRGTIERVVIYLKEA